MDESGQAPTTAYDIFLAGFLSYSQTTLSEPASSLGLLLNQIPPFINETELSTPGGEEFSPLSQQPLSPRTPVQHTTTTSSEEISIQHPTHHNNILIDWTPIYNNATAHLPQDEETKGRRYDSAENDSMGITYTLPSLFDACDQRTAPNTPELINDSKHGLRFTLGADIPLLNLNIPIMESDISHSEAAPVPTHPGPTGTDNSPQLAFKSASPSSPPRTTLPSSEPERQSSDAGRDILPSSASLVQRTNKRIQRRSKVDQNLLENVFSPSSDQPDRHLRSCLDRILNASFYQNDQPEPKLDSEEGKAILGVQVDDQLSSKFIMSKSIYRLFIDAKKKVCLICGHSKGTVLRVIGCVRGHLGHRPFSCAGKAAGCTSCVEGGEPARFFTAALLDDHIKGQMKKYRCEHPNCDSQLRRGGMKRHWQAMHKNDPYPKG